MPQNPDVPPAIAVLGLWHLGTVTAACVADSATPVLGVDPDPDVVAGLRAGRPPLHEPGLADLVRQKLDDGVLRFGLPETPAFAEARIVWVTFDTPVDDDDRADVESVLEHASAALRNAAPNALVVVSAQLPVGSVSELERRMVDAGRSDLRYASVPENLRLGRALETFRAADRFVAGVRSPADRAELEVILSRFSDKVEWMGVESAEMTKHALNAFLATSVAFINELAGICEHVGADATEVARGLKSEQRIGPGAYLAPGDAFAGGTLARDVTALRALATRHGIAAPLVDGVAESNRTHAEWSRRALTRWLGDGGSAGLRGRRIAVWGLTYKPGTDTLRRSAGLQLCDWLLSIGAEVSAYDPAISTLPPRPDGNLELAAGALAAAERADALVVCTPWPDFRELTAEEVTQVMSQPLVLDAGGHLAAWRNDAAVRYVRVGSASA